MPTYDYECEACGEAFELFQQMSDPLKRKCPSCGKAKLKRLIGTGSGVIFKGGGFYETDYRTDNYKKGADAEKKSLEPAKPDSKSDAKSDTKSESKSETKSENKSDSSSDSSKSAPDKPSASDAKPRARKQPGVKTSKRRKR